MSSVMVMIGRQPGNQTFLVVHTESERVSRRIYGLMDKMVAVGSLHEASYCVVCECPHHGLELMLGITQGDHEQQIEAFMSACAHLLSQSIGRLEMSASDYAAHTQLARAARSASN